MDQQVSTEYNAAVGSVMDARKRYETACTAQGAESWAAQQAREYLDREIEHRNEMRRRYDAAVNTPAGRAIGVSSLNQGDADMDQGRRAVEDWESEGGGPRVEPPESASRPRPAGVHGTADDGTTETGSPA